MISFSPTALILYCLLIFPHFLCNSHSSTSHRSYFRTARVEKFDLGFLQHLQDSILWLSSCSSFPHRPSRKLFYFVLVFFLSWWIATADTQGSHLGVLWATENYQRVLSMRVYLKVVHRYNSRAQGFIQWRYSRGRV